MTPMQHKWIVAAALAGTLFACAVGMVVSAAASPAVDAIAVIAPSIGAFVAIALAALALFVFAAHNARRP